MLGRGECAGGVGGWSAWQSAKNRTHTVRFTRVEADVYKRYIRHAIARESFGNNGKAKGCLECGLRVPAQQNNKGIIEQPKKMEN